MKTTGIVARAWNGVAIQRRHADGFVNATAMCKANGKRWGNYMRGDRAMEYLAALAASLNLEIPCAAAVAQNRATGMPCAAAVAGNPATGIQGLIDVIQGGSPDLQGTWIHPRLAVDLARWISPAFAVWMDGWFLESISAPVAPCPPPAAEVRQRPAVRPTYSPPHYGRVALMTFDELCDASCHLWELMQQRRNGDMLANGMIRAFAHHLLISCDPLAEAPQVTEGLQTWLAARRLLASGVTRAN